MTLNLIGIGLNDEKDITVKGLELVKKSDLIYLESYTSKLQCEVSVLEEFYGKKVIIADRDMVESDNNEIIENSKDKEVSLLIIGDVFSATTHTDIMMRCKELKIDVKIVNNAAILTAVGITGLQLYKFGKTTSIPYPEENFAPETAYDVIKENNKIGLHTLCLLDIKKDLEKYMSVNEAIEILLKIEDKRGENVFTNETFCIGCARLGGDFVIKAGKASELLQFDFGKPLHCLIVPGKMHFMEEDILNMFKVTNIS